jgi:hypothetical protein
LQQISLILIKKCSQNRRNKIWEWEVWAEAEKSKERRAKRSNGRVGEWGCRAGVPTVLPPCMRTCRIRRVRHQRIESAGREFFPSGARSPGPSLVFRELYRPDTIPPNRVRKSRQARAPASFSVNCIGRIQFLLITSGGHNGALIMKLATH